MFSNNYFSNRGFSAILLVVVIVLAAIVVGLTTAKRTSSPEEPRVNLKQSAPKVPDDSQKVKVNVNWVQLNENINLPTNTNVNAPVFVPPPNTNTPAGQTPLENVNSSPSVPQSNNVTIALTARQWEFDPSVVRVKLGAEVTLHITSVDVLHGFGLPDFGVSQNLEPGKTTTIKFVASKKGTFSFFCNVYCGEGHGSMRGTIVVE